MKYFWMSVSVAATPAKSYHHYCHFVLTGGASQSDVPVVFCYSSPYPVPGHVISQVHTHTPSHIQNCVCDTYLLNFHHFTFSFYSSAATKSDLYLTDSVLTDWPQKLSRKLPNVQIQQVWFSGNEIPVSLNWHWIFSTTVSKEILIVEFPAFMENYNDILCCHWNYSASICSFSLFSTWCLSVSRVYTLIHVVSYRSTEKDYKERDDVSNNTQDTHTYIHIKLRGTGILVRYKTLQRLDYIKALCCLGPST